MIEVLVFACFVGGSNFENNDLDYLEHQFTDEAACVYFDRETTVDNSVDECRARMGSPMMHQSMINAFRNIYDTNVISWSFYCREVPGTDL